MTITIDTFTKYENPQKTIFRNVDWAVQRTERLLYIQFKKNTPEYKSLEKQNGAFYCEIDYKNDLVTYIGD